MPADRHNCIGFAGCADSRISRFGPKSSSKVRTVPAGSPLRPRRGTLYPRPAAGTVATLSGDNPSASFIYSEDHGDALRVHTRSRACLGLRRPGGARRARWHGEPMSWGRPSCCWVCWPSPSAGRLCWRRPAGSIWLPYGHAGPSFNRPPVETLDWQEQLSAQVRQALRLAESHLIDYPQPHVLATEHLLLGLAERQQRGGPVAGGQRLGHRRAGGRNRSAGRPRPRAAADRVRHAARRPGRCPELLPRRRISPVGARADASEWG